MNMYEILDKIALLEYDWNGYGAEPFTISLIDKCKNILDNIIKQPKIYPTGRNSIQFEYELEDRSYLEFEIFEDKITYLQVPQRNYNSAIDGTLYTNDINKINEIIREFYNGTEIQNGCK